MKWWGSDGCMNWRSLASSLDLMTCETYCKTTAISWESFRRSHRRNNNFDTPQGTRQSVLTTACAHRAQKGGHPQFYPQLFSALESYSCDFRGPRTNMRTS